MNKWQAIHSIWSSFGIPAYDETDVPDNAVMPYITYAASVSSFEQPFILSGSIWYRSNAWDLISQRADMIAEYLRGYKLIKVNGGYLHVSEGSPFAQRMGDEDSAVRRIYITIDAEFFTEV